MSESAASVPPLVEQILSGTNKGLQRLAAEGLVPLPPEDLIPLQVRLATGEDSEIADLANASLGQLEPRVVQELVQGDGSPALVHYFATHSQHPTVVEAVLQRRDVTAELLCALAPKLSPDLQEILLLRQDLIVENREILTALEQNPQLSAYTQRRIVEYREHLLGELRRAREAEEELIPEDEISEEELQASIEEVRETVEAVGEVDEITGLSESQIRAMTPSLRMKLARGASRSLRSILIKDKNPNVAVAVLSGSAITEQEIEQAAANRNIVEDVLTRISAKREWIGKYQIMHNLVRNPRTPIAIAIRQLPRLSLRDLGTLRMDRNVPDAVRQQARRLHQAKKTG